ncbi:MAG: transposase [Elusimicrobia bacterium]|nr:transposase [Elusimicrobiota bacterium]
MGRRPRIHFPGAIYHVTTRGNEGRAIFLEEADRPRFFGILAEEKARSRFQLFAHCLMSNHLHLLLRVAQVSLSVIMQRILTRYSCRINARRRVHGHLFQGRFKDALCQDDSYFRELLRYIHMNPVRAGVVSDPSEWTWSGHLDYTGARNDGLIDTRFGLSLFHPDASQARRCYLDFLERCPVGADAIPSPPEKAAQPLAHEDAILEGPGICDAALIQDMETLGRQIARSTGVSLEALRSPSRNRTASAARRDLVRLSLSEGIGTCEIARFLGRTPSFVYKASCQ